MVKLSGSLTARLADKNESYEKRLVDEINVCIKPPRPVGPSDVHIRAMYIVSDQINSQGGCFAEDELDRLAGLIVDSPVIIGHQRDSLPLARNFKAHKVKIDGRMWVKSYFYWMKDSEGAEDLKNNIDGGIYKECSISFLFNLPECSICGRDIRECRHIPFREYDVDSGGREIAHFKYREIEKVLETSLVFRGSIPDTHITDRLFTENDGKTVPRKPAVATHFFKLLNQPCDDLNNRGYGRAGLSFNTGENFEPDKSVATLYSLPYQPGMNLRVVKKKDSIQLDPAASLPEKITKFLTGKLAEIKVASFVIDTYVFAVRGKERLNGMGLIQVINSGNNLHRLRLKICDAVELDGKKLINEPYGQRLEKLRTILNDNSPSGIEIRRTDTSLRQDWRRQTAIDGCAGYNFGLEIITEDVNGILKRNILSKETQIPAVVKKMEDKSGVHLTCGLKTIEQKQRSLEIVCPRITGLILGNVALLTGRSSGKCDDGVNWSISDLLPGSRPEIIIASAFQKSGNITKLHFELKGNRLLLFFRENNRRRSVTIHNFSAELFRRGRRFIADMSGYQGRLRIKTGGQAVSIQSITRSGKLIFIQLSEKSSVFGDISGLWLRPVLIDGMERYMFYASKTTRLPAEL
jgi:hypothetical protein